MNKIECTIHDMKSLMEQMSHIYDAVRLVNASECCTMSLDENGKIIYGNPCYAAWNRTSRCANCSSYRAHKTGIRQKKTELFQNNVYTILSIPTTLILDDGTPYSCIMELITVAAPDSAAPEIASSEETFPLLPSMDEEHDMLTGLCSSEEFYKKTRLLLKKAQSASFYIIYADIDDFKLVNDLFGRVRGNEILLKTAALLKQLCQSGDLCSRFSADNFFICMDKEHFLEAVFLAAAKKVAAFVGHSAISLNLRFGIYEVTERELAVSTMCDRAKLAIAPIKGDSQKFIAFYTNDLREQKIYEQKVVSEFDRTLKEKQFQIYLQPQISSDAGLQGAEVLVRWQHSQKGLLLPGDFIGILERRGLISRLDCYVWEEAVALLARWKDTDKDYLHLSINISGKDFYYLDVYQTLTSLVEKYRIAPEKLRLEITETVLMSDVEKLIRITSQLRHYGFHIEIDDFGKGYSSLSMLKDIDVDVLKIDMEFLQETEHQDKGKVILGSVINMSKDLGMAVITEGVETQTQVEHLRKLGCDTFQGFYFARPMPVDAFERKYFPQADARA